MQRDVPDGIPPRRVIAMSLAASAVVLLGVGVYFVAARAETVVGTTLVGFAIAEAATAAFFAGRSD